MSEKMELAGPLYVRARKWLDASHCYEQLDNFSRAIKILDEHEMYDEAIDCLQRYNIRKQVCMCEHLHIKGMSMHLFFFLYKFFFTQPAYID